MTRDPEHPERDEGCVSQYFATPEKPCWVDLIYHDETDQGDVFYNCEGHRRFELSAAVSDAENASNYRAKPHDSHPPHRL